MKILITGGTGFLGRHLVKHYVTQGHEVVSFARREQGHEEQSRELRGLFGEKHLLRSWIGDVRDQDTVQRAMAGCGAVIHCAAQKHVPWGEEFPEECIKTNVQGTINVQQAARKEGIDPSKAILISTDKAVKPINTYGASKFLAECVWAGKTIRFGNIWGSTGSVVYWLLAQRGNKEIKITDKNMLRYHIKAEECAAVVSHELETPTVGKTTPIMPWYTLVDLCEAVAQGVPVVTTGIRRGEKLIEDLDGIEAIGPRMTVRHLRKEVETLCGSMGMADTPKSSVPS